MIMDNKTLYQIINLGTPLIGDVKELNILDGRVSFVFEEKRDSSLPCLYLYWGVSKDDKKNKTGLDLDKLVYDGMIIPVVIDTSKFKEYIPDELGSINALQWNPKTPATLGNRVLRYFGLLDCTNKVFISYKRSDTSALAHQLYEALIKAKFHPFLDCYNIDSGVPFQEYLRNEVADSDVFLYLNSPNYDDSEYTREERECAQKLSLGILQVIFRGSNSQILLNSKDINTDEIADKEKVYSEEFVNSIVKEVDRQRAVMYEYRRKALINSYRMLNDGDHIYIMNSGIIYNVTKHELLNVIVRVPNSIDFHKTDKMINWQMSPENRKCLLYDSQFVRRDILDHIQWLNTSLPIKSIDINE